MTEKKDANKSTKPKSQKSQNPKTKTDQTSEILDITTFAEYQMLEEELKKTKIVAQESIELAKIYKKDMDRIKNRFKEQEKELEEKLTIELASKLLKVLDNFEKSFEHISDESTLQGFRMIYQSLVDVLEGMGIERFESAGKDFDADSMNAIMSEKEKEDGQAGKVAQVFAEGYVHSASQKIVRYAQVSVYN